MMSANFFLLQIIQRKVNMSLDLEFIELKVKDKVTG